MQSTTVDIVSTTAADFEADVIEASRERLVLVDFWAGWCGPCKALAPVLEQVAAERAEAVRVVKLDVDAEPRPALDHGVRALPTLLLFRDGREVDRLVGLQSAAAILQAIDRAATA